MWAERPGWRRRRGLRLVPARGPRPQGRSRRRRRGQGRRRLAASPTATSRRCSRSATTRTGGPAAARTAQGKKQHGQRRRRPRWSTCPRARSCTTHDGDVLADLVHHGDRWLAAAGGRGGRGNARFLSNRRRAPTFAEQGEVGEERWLRLELKLMADVALVGFPNVGKSTLISRDLGGQAQDRRLPVHHARAEPRRGALDDDVEFVVADIPGLIEGASEGRGLGHQFLRHVERARVLCVLLDLARGRRDVARASRSACCSASWARYRPELLDRPRVVVGSEADIADRRRGRDRGSSAVTRRRASPSSSGATRRRSSRPGPRRRARAATAFVVHRPAPEGVDRSSARTTASCRSSAVRPSGPWRCPTSPTLERSPTRTTAQAARRRPGPGPRRRRATATSCTSAGFELRATEPDDLADASDRRRQDRHVVAHRRRGAIIDADAIAKFCAEVARAPRRRPPGRGRDVGGDRRRAARARARRDRRPVDMPHAAGGRRPSARAG